MGNGCYISQAAVEHTLVNKPPNDIILSFLLMALFLHTLLLSPALPTLMESDPGFLAALSEARTGFVEGGVPIGACLVSASGQILGQGHNMRVQKNSATLHAEISCLEDAGRLPGSQYKGATIYTTLSPCDMCTGACVMFGVKRVVIGENETFVGGEEYLKERGVEVVVLESNECRELMRRFVESKPEVW